MNMRKKIGCFLKCLFAAAIVLICGCETWNEGFIDWNMNLEDPNILLNLTEPQEEADLTVTQLLKRMREAADPKGVWYNSQSYILRQTAVTQEKRGFSTVERYYVTEIKYRQPEQMRQTSYEDGKPFQTLLYRDNKAWVIDRKGNAAEYTGEGMKLFRNYIGFADPKASEQTLFSSIALGVVYENERRVYRMICRTADSQIPPYVTYVDAETFLPIRMETILIKGSEQKLYRAEPQDYKWISDFKTATTTIVTIGDDESMEYHTTELLINPDIPDSEFTVSGKNSKIDYTRVKE